MTADNRVEDFEAIAKRLQAEIDANGGAVSYEVRVERMEQVVVEQEGDWGIIAEVAGEGKDYGYPPSRPRISQRDTVEFIQVVKNLDLAEVVKAVNGLK